MQTITRKDTDVSLYLLNDDVAIIVTDENTTIGDPPEYIISDCSALNSTVYTNAPMPEDWVGWKYLYTTENGWVLNPDWTPPA